MKIENLELLKNVLRDIVNLRDSLIALGEAYPHLVADYDSPINGLEIWTIDEILERVQGEVVSDYMACVEKHWINRRLYE